MSAPDTGFFQSGGALLPAAASYVERAADRELLGALQAGEFCYVLTARQMGKSSLMVRTTQLLRAQGVHVAAKDISGLGYKVTAEQWYGGLLASFGPQLGLEAELEDWWRAQARLAPVHRFFRALREVVLERRRGTVVLFLDEIDLVRSLQFDTDEFFGALKECCTGRAQDAALHRLTFCLFGVATPAQLQRNPDNPLFNLGRGVELRDFTRTEMAGLARGLLSAAQPDTRLASAVLDRVHHWTRGQPYLTQKFCRVAAGIVRGDAPAEAQELAPPARAEEAATFVDRLADLLFLSARARAQDSNLSHIHDRLAKAAPRHPRLPGLCRRILTGRRVRDAANDEAITVLHLSGLVRVEQGRLRVRNRIYELVFDRTWAAGLAARAPETAPARALLRRPVAAGLAVAAALALGFVLWRQAAAPPPALAILPVGYAGADADGQARWAGFWQAVSLAVEGGLPPRRTPVLLGPNAVRDLGVSSEAGARRALRARWVLSGRVTERPDVPALLELRLSDRRGRGRGTNLVIAPANPAESHAEAAIAVLDLLDLPADATARQILREGGTRRPAAAQWFQSGLELARGTREADLVRAQEQLRHATQADPAYAAAWAALAAVTHRLHLDSRDTNLLALALDQARRALALQTNNLLARITEARLLAARGQPGDLAAAEAALKTVLAAQPGRNDARHALADVMRRWQPPRTAEARRLLQAAAARSPQDVPVLMTYGEFLARGGEADLRAAAEVFRRVIRLAPDNALAHSNLGGVLHLLGETAAAEAELVRALELSELPEARSNLGTLRFFAGRYAEAVEDFRRAANWRPRSAVIHGNLGDALRTAGRPPAEYLPAYAEAARLAERELASTASAPEMRSSLALYLAVLGRGDEALAQVARLEAAGGASAHDWLACAVAAELAGRRPHALALLRRALDQGLPPAEITAHPDLQRLRADPDFSALVPKL